MNDDPNYATTRPSALNRVTTSGPFKWNDPGCIAMLFEDLYDSVLRRYRVSSPKAEQERQGVPGPFYAALDAAQQGREAQAKTVPEENVKGKNPSD